MALGIEVNGNGGGKNCPGQINKSVQLKMAKGFAHVPSKRSKVVIQSIQYVLSLCEAHMEEDIKALSPLQRVRLWADLQEYVRPKLARIEQTGDDGGPVKHNHTVVLRPQPQMIEAAKKEKASKALSENGVGTLDHIELPGQSDEVPFYDIAAQIKTNGVSTTVSTHIDADGTATHSIESVREIPEISDDLYYNTIPESEAVEVK